MKNSEINIGQILKEKRKALKIRLQDLADYVGVDIATLSKIENEKRGIPQRYVKKLSSALNMSEDDLQSMIIANDIFAKYGGNTSLKNALLRASSMVKK